MQKELGLASYVEHGQRIVSSLYVLTLESAKDSDLSSAIEMLGKSVGR